MKWLQVHAALMEIIDKKAHVRIHEHLPFVIEHEGFEGDVQRLGDVVVVVVGEGDGAITHQVLCDKTITFHRASVRSSEVDEVDWCAGVIAHQVIDELAKRHHVNRVKFFASGMTKEGFIYGFAESDNPMFSEVPIA